MRWIKATATLLLLVLALGSGSFGIGDELFREDWQDRLLRLMIGPVERERERLSIEVWTDEAFYRVRDNVKIFLSLNKDAYVYVFDVTRDMQVINIFPNEFSGDNFIQAGTYTLPDNPDYVIKVIEASGLEVIVAFATDKPVEITKEHVLGAVVSQNPLEFIDQAIAVVREIPEEWATDFALCVTTEGPVPSSGELVIDSDPQGAEIYIEDQFWGTTPEHIQLAAGRSYRVELRMEGHVLWLSDVFIRTEEVESISVTLEGVVFQDGFETGDFSWLPWRTNAEIDTNEYHWGSYAAEMDPGEYLELEYNVPAGTISFFGHPNEGGTELRFLIDGQEVCRWRETGWVQKTFSVSPGTHIFRWENSGRDCCVEVDDIVYRAEIP